MLHTTESIVYTKQLILYLLLFFWLPVDKFWQTVQWNLKSSFMQRAQEDFNAT